MDHESKPFNQRELMMSGAIKLLFQSHVCGAHIVMAHPRRFASTS
jgi:hypothetical protein